MYGVSQSKYVDDKSITIFAQKGIRKYSKNVIKIYWLYDKYLLSKSSLLRKKKSPKYHKTIHGILTKVA